MHVWNDPGECDVVGCTGGQVVKWQQLVAAGPDPACKARKKMEHALILPYPLQWTLLICQPSTAQEQNS